MRQRILVVAGLAAVGVAIAIAVPLAILAMQGAYDLKFEYFKSGGIGGISERLAFDSMNAFDSKTDIITFYQSTLGTTEKRQISDAKVQELRHAIAESGFFAFDSLYPARNGPADFFSYSLTITMDGKAHSVSWVDDFALAKPVPEGLKDIVTEIEEAYESSSPI